MGCMNYFTPQPQSIIELYNLQEASNFVHANPAIESHKILLCIYSFAFYIQKLFSYFIFLLIFFWGVGVGGGKTGRKKY